MYDDVSWMKYRPKVRHKNDIKLKIMADLKKCTGKKNIKDEFYKN